ncbi:MAG: 3'-5' exonuclease [Burkholderiales bacterium]|nr:3'-5' exonuclease [Burkholderiales bacterium]
MSWLARIAGPRPALDEETGLLLKAWRSSAIVRPHAPFAACEWTVLDTETSGLDVRHHTLLSIGAVRMSGTHVVMGRSFYREIRPERASEKENILVHGIGRGAQLSGEAPQRALAAFMAFAGGRPLVAYNAPFDREMLEGAVLRHLGVKWRPTWIDAADLVKSMFPAEAMERKTLDDWMGRFGIVHYERHNALADALCTAQLFQILLARASREGYITVADLRRAERNYHWQRKR